MIDLSIHENWTYREKETIGKDPSLSLPKWVVHRLPISLPIGQPATKHQPQVKAPKR